MGLFISIQDKRVGLADDVNRWVSIFPDASLNDNTGTEHTPRLCTVAKQSGLAERKWGNMMHNKCVFRHKICFILFCSDTKLSKGKFKI